MAADSVSDARMTTADTEFRTIPAEGRPLLAVLAGVQVTTARREAADLEDAVRRVLNGAIETGADGSTAYLREFALEAASALRMASGCG